MFSPDNSSSYGTLGFLPINVNCNIQQHHHHHSCDNFDCHLATFHYNHACADLQQHSGRRLTTSNYISISSSQTPLQLQPIQSSTARKQIQNIPYSTFAATPASAHPFRFSTTSLDNNNISWTTAHRSPELLHQQLLYQELYQGLRQFSSETAGATSYNRLSHSHNDAIRVHNAVEPSYSITAASQGRTKTSLSNTHGTAAQLGGNGINNNTDNFNRNSNSNSNNDYAGMSEDHAADGDFIVRALHEYHTDSEGHLSFSQFQYVKVRHCDASGWWFGESENNRGWFPSNRVERVAAVYESEITSEDYDQIRTGLDGVEIQFLGEPVMESIVDSIQLDWGAVDSNSGAANITTAHPPVVTVGRTRAGQLAFPPTQLSMIQPTYGSEASSTDMESEMFYQHPESSSNSINTAEIANYYSNFVTEVTQYVMELRDATAKSEVERYQPTVAKIFSCVKALLIFTNTIARESPVLATYPELARSRRVILRALGKLYSKCRVANGAQSPTTNRQRQFATEKLVVFSGQVLEGITDFATCAREIGLRIRAEAASTQAVEREIILATKREANTTPPTSISHGRPRRRVSRANSAKGFKSFNAVRQWKTEHLQKHNTAKKAVECLLSEYMECLNGDQGTKELSRIVRTTIQSAQTVEAYLFSADDTRVRTHFREDEQYIIQKNKLSSTLMELSEFIHIMENVLTAKGPSSEIVLNRLMNLASVLLKCLVDLEISSKSQSSNQEPSPLSGKRISFSEDRPSSHAIPGSASDSKLFSRSVANEETPKVSEEQAIQHQLATDTTAAAETTAATTTEKVAIGTSATTTVAAVVASVPPKTAASRNTAPARPKPSTAPINSQVSPLSRKFASFNAHSDRNRRQVTGDQQAPELDGSHLNPEAAYGEAHDLERNNVDVYRSSHDSAVVIMSGKNTPHHSFLNGQKGPKPLVPVVPVVEEEEDLEEEEDPKEQLPKDNSPQEQLSGTIKEAGRTITALFLPTTEAPHQLQQVDVPVPDYMRQRVSMPIHVRPAVGSDSTTPPRPVLRQQHSFESRPGKSSTRTSRTATPEAVNPPTPLQSTLNPPGAPLLRNKQILDVLELQERERELTGLGVSMPAGARPRNMSAPIPLTNANQGSGPGAIPRPSGITRARSPVQSSPRLEASKRMPRRDPSPNSHSSNSNSDSRTLNRSGGQTSTNLSPGMQPGSRRGSENSIRSDISLPRKSSDSQAMREHEPRQDYQDRRQQQSQHQLQYHQQQQQLAQAAGRRGSKASVNGPATRTEGQGAKADENVLSGLTTPTTPQVQTFQEGQSTVKRPAKNQRRESVASNLSVATESGIHSRSAGRPLSPSQRNRINNQYQDTNSIRGRVSTESTMSQSSQQHQQLIRGGPSPTSYRARQNRIAPTRGRLSGEFKQEGNSATSATPWFLGDDYEPEDVHYNDNGVLVAATLDAFIEMLTSHKNAPDSALVMTFFTTFRLFTSPLELTELLIKRFMKPPPAGLSEQELSVWTQQKQERVQKRVHIAFKTWLEGYWVSEKDREAFRPITEFVTLEMKKTLPGPAGRLLDMLTQWGNKRRSLCVGGRSPTLNKARSHERLNQLTQDQQQGENSNSNYSNAKQYSTVRDKTIVTRKGLGGIGGRESISSRGPPAPAVTKALLNALSNEQTMCKVSVTDIKAVELARQITILVSKLYADIPYLELLSKDKPNCSRMIQVSNRITEWLIETVVDEHDVKRRVMIVKHWIEVGEECLKMNNFDTLMAITNGIESTPVSRLYNTWEGINKIYLERFVQLKKAISSEANYSAYRNKLKTVLAPCIPFLGLYFKAITYIEDGNSPYKELTPAAAAAASQQQSSTTSPSASSEAQPATPTPVVTRKLLRYGRFHQLAKAVQEFRGFQGAYELLEVPRLRDYITKCMENQDPERSYTKSLAIEPRRPALVPNGQGSSVQFAANGGRGGAQQRASGQKGLFHGGVSNSEMNGSGSAPVKLNKLSFFRKSVRAERS